MNNLKISESPDSPSFNKDDSYIINNPTYIAIFLHSSGNNGANQVILDIVLKLSKLNYFIDIYVNKISREISDIIPRFETDELLLNNVKVIESNYYPTNKEIRFNKYDSIIVNCFMRGDVISSLINYDYNGLILWYIHENELPTVESIINIKNKFEQNHVDIDLYSITLDNFMKKNNTSCIFVAEYNTSLNWKKYMDYPDKQYKIINNGIEHNKFTDFIEKYDSLSDEFINNTKLKYNININSPILLCIGSIGNRKNQMQLVECMKNIIDELKSDNIKPVLILKGDRTNKENPRQNEILYINHIKKFIIDNNFDEYVRILPLDNNIEELLSICDIFVNLSKSEVLSLAMIEASIFKKPLIVSDVGATSTFIDDNGFLIDIKENEINFIDNKILELGNNSNLDNDKMINFLKNKKQNILNDINQDFINKVLYLLRNKKIRLEMGFMNYLKGYQKTSENMSQEFINVLDERMFDVKLQNEMENFNNSFNLSPNYAQLSCSI